MKNVYTVHGSEDGLIGVYSNLDKACKVAAAYSESDQAQASNSFWIYEGVNRAEVEKWQVE
jgi:hypothetical protein